MERPESLIRNEIPAENIWIFGDVSHPARKVSDRYNVART